MNNIKYDFYDKLKIEGRIKNINAILNMLGKDWIWSTATLENNWLSIHYPDYEESFLVMKILDDKIANIAGTTKIWEAVYMVADADEKWNERRNKEYTSLYYLKFRLKKNTQSVLKKYFEEMLITLKRELTIIEKQLEEAERKKEEERNQYSIIKTYRHVTPSGGEFGADGYYDVDIMNNKTSRVVRMVSRDVFDFGVYNHPKRYEGTDGVFDRNKWTNEEKDVSKWLAKNAPFGGGIRM